MQFLPIRSVLTFLTTLLFLGLASFFLHAQQTQILTAREVKDLSLTQNVSIKIAELSNKIGAQDLAKAKSIYDTTLSAEVSHAEDKSQRTTTVFGTETKETIYHLELGQKTPLGTEMSVGFLNDKESSDSAFFTVNPVYDSQIQLSLRQPVAQNFFGLIDRRQVQIARKRVEALDGYTRASIQSSIYSNLVHYWQFYLSYHNVSLEKQALNKAYELYLANQKKQDIGLIEKSDLYAFAANRDIREATLLVAENDLASATEGLRMDIDLDPGLSFKPGKENFYEKFSQTLDQAILVALENRPDYSALIKEVEASKLNVAMKKNSTWPEVDVVASLALNGVDGNYGTSVKNIGDGNEAWLVGMEFNLPIPNRYYRSEYKKSQYENAKKILELKQKELEITRQVMEKVKQCKNGAKRMEALIRAKDNQYNKMVEEMRKYEQGRSDSDTVIRYQNDYIDAQKLELASRVDYRIAQLSLEYVQGKIMDE